ncbi:V-set domain-containing T-cell activation inhibitor 1-like [Stigmatopora argus]
MIGTLWSISLLLNFIFIPFCDTLGEECIVGIVGQPLQLSCFYPDAAGLDSVSARWRRNGVEAVGGDEGDQALALGNFTLRIPAVDPREDNASYSVVVTLRGNQSVEACTLCVRVAAPFSAPEVRWEASSGAFRCHAGGGFPAPSVLWLVDGVSSESAWDSPRTLAEQRPDTRLYDVTSYLSVNVTDANVSCVIRNDAVGQTLTSTTRVELEESAVTRASDALWVFSTALCVVVGVMVAAGLVYQIHLDRVSKKKKIQRMSGRIRGYRRRLSTEETEVITMESFNDEGPA